ncbi:MAG: Gfo/Idh/MocA family oxidoreductase, partial [Anaerovibrio sp.]|nr:Gfo/Idh/MocA family oxidoreductase [Anaerovibrio sp.]
KELDFFISTSYGPGRYDEVYEEKGLEYPVGYVRWTENRNLQEVISLIAQGKLQVADMVSAVYPVEQADKAYESLKTVMPKPLMVLLSYLDSSEKQTISKVVLQERQPLSGKVRLAVVGAGNFAKSMHLPNILSLQDKFHLRAIMSRTGANAKNIAQQFGADYATTSYDDVLQDKEVDAVLITTRHNLHKDMVLAALKAGKHVLVEKPLAVNREELAEIEAYMAENPQAPLLLTGFNRRHSQYLQEINRHTCKRINPLIINYRMNAGYIPLDVWVHTEEGAGRNIGEACHIYDLFNFLTGAKPVSVSAHSIKPHTDYYSAKDNFVVTVSYDDGSVANLIYTAMGNSAYPKESMEIFYDNKMIALTDYKQLQGYGVKIKKIQTKASDKGQLEEIAAFAEAIQNGKRSPVSFAEQVMAMEIAFAVEEQI